MNRRGFFLTITAVLILIIVVSIVLGSNRTKSETSDLSVSRERARTVSLALERMHTITIPAAAGLALTESVDELGSGLDAPRLQTLSETGTLGALGISHPLDGLSQTGAVLLNDPIGFTITNYEVTGISQRDAFTLDVTVDLTVAFTNPQMKGNLTYTGLVVPVSIVGAQDPWSSVPRRITKSGYAIDPTRSCYLATVEPGASCLGADGAAIGGLVPLTT